MSLSHMFVTHGQWRIQRGLHGFHGTPLLKGCLRKYYEQTYYVHYPHTVATHFIVFSFNSCNNVRVSTPVSRIRRAHGLRACIHYQKYMATIETISEASECLFMQLGMAICYQHENAYFPTPYADSQLLYSLCDPKWSHAFNSAGWPQTQQPALAVGCPTFANSPHENTRNDLRRSEIQNFSGEACPQTPLTGALCAC